MVQSELLQRRHNIRVRNINDLCVCLAFTKTHALSQAIQDNIVTGMVPKGTFLYHGTTRGEFQLRPEWFPPILNIRILSAARSEHP